MTSRFRVPLVLGAAVAGLLVPASSQAATTTLEPHPVQARNFTGGNGGWTSQVTESCGTPGLFCADGNASYQPTGGADGAGDGYLRESFATVAGVAGTTTVAWRSPTFVAPADTDQASLTTSVRSDVDGLLGLNSSSALSMVLVDTADNSRSTVVSSAVPIPDSATFVPIRAAVPAGALTTGRTYRVELRSRVTSGALSVAAAGNVDLDDVALTAVDLLPPASLSSSVDTSGSLRVTGSVDPQGQTTNVSVEYGPTTNYTASTAPVQVSGNGPQSFAIPLAGLTAGSTVHYRVVATNADGTTTTQDATFTVPQPPANASPTVSGALNARARSVTYDQTAGTTAVSVEVLDGTTVVSSTDDPDLDGNVAISLPNADGDYTVRVVRTGAGGQSSTSAGVPTSLDRVAPSTAGLGLSVDPAVSSSQQRTVSFTVPSDATSADAQVLDSNGNAVGGPVAVQGGMATVQLGSADGDYSVRVTVRDASGNAATATSGTVSLDSMAPSAGAAPTVTGDGNDPDRTVSFDLDPSAQSAVVEVRDASGTLVDSRTLGAGVDTTAITLGPDDGTYEVRVRQTDAAGNQSDSPVTQVALDRQAPAAGGAPAVMGAGNAASRDVTFQRDPSTTDASVDVLDANDNVVQTVPASGNTATVTLPSEGQYRIRVRQRDAAGNEATSPAADAVYDTTAPAAGGAPSVTGAETDRDRQVTFTRDPSTTTASIEVRDSQGNLVSSVPASGNSGTITLPAGSGDYTVRVVQSDAAGNTSTTASTPAHLTSAPATPPATPGTPPATPGTPPAAPGATPPVAGGNPAGRSPGAGAGGTVPAPGGGQPSSTITNTQFGSLVRSLSFDAQTGRGPGGSIVPISRCTIVGTSRKDVLRGTKGNDVICGLGGNDVISGGTGNDIVDAGDGNDRVTGGSGRDVIFGLRGSDRLSSGTGNDTLSGGDGNDRLKGESGNDVVFAGNGRDRVAGGKGNDRLSGGKGNDMLDGSDGNDRVSGDAGSDRLMGRGGADRLAGGQGNDVASGGSGSDSVGGGSGDDQLNTQDRDDDRVRGGSGRDRVNGDRGTDDLSGVETRG